MNIFKASYNIEQRTFIKSITVLFVYMSIENLKGLLVWVFFLLILNKMIT